MSYPSNCRDDSCSAQSGSATAADGTCDWRSSVATAQGTYESLQIAEAGAAALQDNAKLMQRAYSLGEANLQAVLTAQLQATAAAQNSLAARTAALRDYYLLLIDAHLVCDLDHD